MKRYDRDLGSNRILELLSGGDPRVRSVLGLVGVIATLARKRKAQEITSQDCVAMVAEIERDWRSFVKIELTLETLDQARDAVARLALRGADAVHFAALRSLDMRVSSSGHRVVLVASDLELKDAAEASGFTVLDPETESAA